jgi:hypothetical protein
LAFYTVEKIVSSGTQSVLSTLYLNKRLEVLEARNSGRLIHCRNSLISFSRVNSKFYKKLSMFFLHSLQILLCTGININVVILELFIITIILFFLVFCSFVFNGFVIFRDNFTYFCLYYNLLMKFCSKLCNFPFCHICRPSLKSNIPIKNFQIFFKLFYSKYDSFPPSCLAISIAIIISALSPHFHYAALTNSMFLLHIPLLAA